MQFQQSTIVFKASNLLHKDGFKPSNIDVYDASFGNDLVIKLVFNQQNNKVNTLSAPVLGELEALLDAIEAKIKGGTQIKLVAFASAKQDIFIAGADINEIKEIKTKQEAKAKVAKGQAILHKISTLPCQTIALINGACMGGGLELALACTYRLASDNAKTKLALPEVNLGIIPGFGGCVRLPRLIGLINASQMILSGAPVDAKKAQKQGLIDYIAPLAFFEEHCNKLLQSILSTQFKVKRSKFLSQVLFKYLILMQAKTNVLKLTKGHYPAPLKAVDVLHRTFFTTKNIKKELQIELEAFCELCTGDISKNLIDVFFKLEALKKDSFEVAEGTTSLNVDETAVLGAGVMGGGIAWLMTMLNKGVKMKDVNLKAIGLGFGQIANNYNSLIKKRKLKPEQVNQKYNLVTFTMEDADLKNCDLVIEAIVEDLSIKQKVLANTESVVKKDAIIATNTSSLLVSDIAKNLQHKDRFIGMHFFNPVNKMPLIEVIKTKDTSPAVVQTVVQIARQAGKIPVVVGDCAGFVVNRILMLYMNEALKCLETTGDTKLIDEIFLKFGMPMGPFTLADEVGLDVCYKVAQNLYAAFGERAKPSQMLERLYKDQHLLGKKGGAGFYTYKDGVQQGVNPSLKAILRILPQKQEVLSDKQIIQTCLKVAINEARLIVDEGIVQNPDHIDIAMIMGTGFPAFRGGLVSYAKQNNLW